MLSVVNVFPEIVPWLFLVLTIITIFIKPRIWPIGLLFTLLSGFHFDAISFLGLGGVILLFSMAFYARKLADSSLNKTLNLVLTLLILIGCIGLAAHAIPGFNNLLILNQVEKSVNSVPFSMYFNFDKPMILFILLVLYPTVLVNQKGVRFLPAMQVSKFNLGLPLVTIISFTVIFLLANLLSLITFEADLPRWWWWFAINNLLLTCVVEEVFFRGVIQQKLARKFSPVIGILVASILFGIAHFAGGINYMLVAILAGFLYGFIYLQTGKLWQAILIHFCLNMTHLYLFTYPLAKSYA